MLPKTRREFLHGSVYAVAAGFAPWPSAWSEITASSRPVKVWITSEQQKFTPERHTANDTGSELSKIRVNLGTTEDLGGQTLC